MTVNIPIEFLPDLWITDEDGIQGKGSAFCEIEQIQHIFLLDKKLPYLLNKKFNILDLTLDELMKQNYIDAFAKIIIETWSVYKPVLIIGNNLHVNFILISILTQYMNISPTIAVNIIKTKIDR